MSPRGAIANVLGDSQIHFASCLRLTLCSDCVCVQSLSRVWLFVTPWTPVSSVHEICQAAILEWVAISYSSGSFRHRDQTHLACISCIGRWILYHFCHLGNTTVISLSEDKPTCFSFYLRWYELGFLPLKMSQDWSLNTNGITLCLTVFSRRQYTVGNVSCQSKLIWVVLKWSLTSDSRETAKLLLLLPGHARNRLP